MDFSIKVERERQIFSEWYLLPIKLTLILMLYDEEIVDLQVIDIFLYKLFDDLLFLILI